MTTTDHNYNDRGSRRRFARLKDKADELRARMEKAEDTLRQVLEYYECDCPEYKRDNCERRRCGAHASDLMAQLSDYERWKDVSAVLAKQSKSE